MVEFCSDYNGRLQTEELMLKGWADMHAYVHACTHNQHITYHLGGVYADVRGLR